MQSHFRDSALVPVQNTVIFGLIVKRQSDLGSELWALMPRFDCLDAFADLFFAILTRVTKQPPETSPYEGD